MSVPKLVVPSSGYGTRGYRNPFTGEVVPGVTGVLDALDKPGLVNWHVTQTAAWAVSNVDALLNRSEEEGVRYLQFYSRRLNAEKMDQVDVYNYSMGVLDDLSETGNFIHSYTESVRNEWPEEYPPETRTDLWQMIEAFHVWESEHTFETTATEATLFGDGYAGTADWFGILDGVATLGDDKTSRRVYDSHEAQLAALGSTHTWAREVPEGTPGAVYYKIVPSTAAHHGGQVDSWWVEEPVPAFAQYGVLQIRPDDYDTKGKFLPAHCEFHKIHDTIIEAGWDSFQAALAAKRAQRKRKEALKALGKEY